MHTLGQWARYTLTSGFRVCCKLWSDWHCLESRLQAPSGRLILLYLVFPMGLSILMGSTSKSVANSVTHADLTGAPGAETEAGRAGLLPGSVVTNQRGNPDNTDFDLDGIPDDIDVDDDNDAIPDILEGNADSDGDGQPDCLDLDSDNDGIPDLTESIADGFLPGSLDSDKNGAVDSGVFLGANGLADLVETSPDSSSITFNLSDFDGDGVADLLDLDSDNDGLFDILEAGSSDLDGDGRADGFSDSDTNGYADSFGNGLPLIADSDGDDSPDFRDTDSDNDGLSDLLETAGITSDIDNNGSEDVFIDTDQDGVTDNRSTNPLAFVDVDGDGFANHLDLDSDGDGLFDLIEAGGVDLDNNGQVDDPSLESDSLADPASVTEQANSPAAEEENAVQPTELNSTENGSGEVDADAGSIIVLTAAPDGNALGCTIQTGRATFSSEQGPRWFDPTLLVLLVLSLLRLSGRKLRLLLVCSASLLLTACNSTGFTPYAGIGVGGSSLELDTGDSVLELTESSDVAAVVTIGTDVFPRFAVEAQLADLGSARLNNNDEVGYQTLSLTATASALPGRSGFNAFLRGGVGMLRNIEPDNAAIEVDTRNSAHFVTGIGIEYLFNNGVVTRLEAVGHDADAQHASLSLLYRFGRTDSGGSNPPIFSVENDPKPTPATEPRNLDLQASTSATTAQSSISRDPVPQSNRAQNNQAAVDSSSLAPTPLPDIRPRPNQPPRVVRPVTQAEERTAAASESRPATPQPTTPRVTTTPESPVSAQAGSRESPELGISKRTTVVDFAVPAVEVPELESSTRETSNDIGQSVVSSESAPVRSEPPVADQPDEVPAAITASLEQDLDADGVVDALDDCADTPSSYPVNGKGCLQYQGIVSGIGFNPESDQLSANSTPALDTVAADLKKYPELNLRVQVLSEQDNAAAILLARKRTLAVIRHMVKQGVSGARLKPMSPLIESGSAAADFSNPVVLRTILQ